MPELWDLYDENRKPLGRTHIRGEKLGKGTYHIGVGIWVIDSKNRLLLTLRSPEKNYWPNYWENTAGSVLAGEDSLTGAIRELFEETGIRVSEDELELIDTERTQTVFVDEYVLKKDVTVEEIVFQEGETVGAKKVTVPEFEEMISSGIVAEPVVRRFNDIRDKLEAYMTDETKYQGKQTDTMKKTIPFGTADILIPAVDHEKWAVVACDQYTSEREYWERVDKTVGDAPSALRIILPEVYLGDGDTDRRIEKINKTMSDYLDNGILKEYRDSMIYVERRLADGRTRRGIVGAVDLSGYDYNVGSVSPIRATEGTVLSRIPPRVKIRENAPLELPHIMILIDDPDFSVIPCEPSGETVYDFDLMENGGHLRGSLMSGEAIEKALSSLEKKCERANNPLIFAVGDGNHSLATAKACCKDGNLLSGYALAEIVNIHDPALDFEPIYRIVFGIDPGELIETAKREFSSCRENKVICLRDGGEDEFFVDGLVPDVLQKFIDKYIENHVGASVDYIHGEESLRSLVGENSVGFIFDGISKSELFPYVEKHGALPRKTFSMGEANDKRYYMECRKIK